jgi:SAM-dependent methyltransferase
MSDYNVIAEKYKESKKLLFRKHIEEHTIFQVLGDVTGKSILDLACGEGVYARKMKQRGAAQVVGVDLSERMIDLALAEERREPLGVEYLAGDAAKLGRAGSFDVVTAFYLLNYARSREDLLQFCRTIFDNLKPGGRFVGFNNNPAQPASSFASSRKYGFIKSSRSEPLREGDVITFTNFCDGYSFSLDNYYLSKEAHEQAFAAAGFRWFAWRPPLVSSEGAQLMGEEFWEEFLRHAPLIGMDALK